MGNFKEELDKKSYEPSKLEIIYNQSQEKTIKNIERVGNYLQRYFAQVFMVLLSLFLVGIQQFAEPQFDPYFFLRPKFWYDYLPFITAQWLILFAVVTGNIKYYTENDRDYEKTRLNIQQHVEDDKKTPYIFDGAKEESLKRKIKSFRQKISRIIDKKIKKYRFGTFARLQAFLDGDNTIIGHSDKKRAIRRYERIRHYLQGYVTQISDEYINKNIEHIKVKYIQVTESGLISGFKPLNNETYEPDFQEHTNKVIINDFGIGQLTTMILGFAILSLDLLVKDASIATWIFFTIKMLFLFWVYFKANFRSYTIFKKTELKALQERDSMLNKLKRNRREE